MAEVNASEKAQDLRLRTIDIPYPSIAQELVESVSSSSSSSELMLRLDDLSQDRPRDDRNTYEKGHKRNDDHDKEGKTSTQQQEAKCMETHLQRNLTQQQAHYARQRKVVENMCTTRDLSENSNSPQSSGDHESLVHHCDSSPRKLIDATDCCDQKTTTKSASVSRQRAPFTRDNRSHRQSSLLIDDINDDDDDDSHAQHMLRRIKEKARAEFRRQHLASQESCAAVRARVPTEFYEQEASSDALRRQLELLRRLQVENNRFRHDLRSLRERNDAFKQRDKVREREVTHLRNEVSKLEAIVERDQVSLATADKSAHRLKVTQKKLAVTQAETHDLLVALQEARDARDQLQSDSQAELSNLLVQVNRWKRNAKQLCQQENRTSDELEFYKKTIASLEEEATEHRSQLTEAKREIAKLSAVIEEKNALCESVEMSAADCVKQMEEDFEVLHKTSTQERQKRKKAESVCNKLQVQMERMQGENTLLLSKQRELERELALVKEQWKEGKQTYHDQLQRCTTELEDHVAKHKSDAAVINGLREEYERLETRFEKAEAKAVDLKSKVDDEARFAQEQVKALRVCVEKVLHDASRDDGSVVLENLAHLERSCREEVGHEMPELQVVISALRNAIMNALHDYRRVHHVVRQQDGKLALAVERVTELEHLREEDAARMIELRDQRKLAEQAREIMKQEKIEVLKWGEQTCERSERIEAELKQCGRVVLRLRKELRRALETDESLDELELMKAEALTQSLCVIQKDMDHLVSMRDHWRSKSEKLSHNVNKAKCQVETLAKELDASEDEFKKTLEELEGVHDKNIREQKLQFEQYIADMEGERSSLESKLEAEAMKFAEEQENSKRLQHVVDGFEQDLPVFATIFHLFLLVVQPLVLQVSDLLAQKRLLLRENADFAQTNGEIECIGQVLKEMMPATALSQKRMNERHRRRAFRRVVIAVFAMNRFQHCVVSATSCAREDLSPYGLCAPLKALETTKRSLQPTVIRVLPPQETLSALALDPMLKELKKLRITETLAEILESTSSPSANVPLSLSNLILKVMMVMHPSSKELLVANTNGSFHCEVLLERRHSSKKRVECDSLEEDIPTVALIRKRILALGKRAEDLYYQRNSLQNEKYEFQCQLEQQANSLKDMDNLLDKTDDLQDQVATLRSQQDAELQRLEQERHAMDQLMQCKEDELVKVQTRMESLEAEASSTERQIEQLQSDKVRLQGELDHLKDIYAEEEGKAERSSAVVRRQEEEVRSLKQAVKKAHELYEKVSWQLEQEVQEKSALQTVVNHIRRQQDKAQRELCEEKVRKVEQNFKAESDGDGMKEATFNHCKADMVSPSAMDQRARSSGRMGSELDELDDGKHRQRRCENSALNVSDRNEPSTLVSPLPSGIAHFLNEWQQLDLSKVLNDTSSPTEVTRPFSLKSALLSTASSCDASCQSPTHERNERLKIDKANAAVNDYMNRIDSKLNRMYGIPPSSAIQRSTMEYKSDLARDSNCET